MKRSLNNRLLFTALVAALALPSVAMAGAPAAKKAADKPAAAVAAPAAAAAAAASAAAPAAAALPKIQGGEAAWAGIAAVAAKESNGKVQEVKKKRGDTPTVAPSRDAVVAWFTQLNIKHVADESGRLVIPFRDEATGINFNILLIFQQKASGNTWAVRAVIPLAIPLPGGDTGLARALILANNWNNEHFLNKISLMQPGDKPFFLLDSTLVCEGGLNQADFFNNFLVLAVQDGLGFAKKGLEELK